MWQALAKELEGLPFTVLAIALDEAEAARPWIEAAQPTYPCLVDRDHVVADLYGIVNVPQAVWIDEAGRIVRPAETAGSTDGFRAVNRQTGALPPEVLEERSRVKRQYFEAVADWVRKGEDSVHLQRGGDAAAPALPDDQVALAHTHFRLGRYLQRSGRDDEARVHLDRASELHPDSWAMWRQSAPKDARGLAAGPEFWARVDALGDKPYYPPARL